MTEEYKVDRETAEDEYKRILECYGVDPADQDKEDGDKIIRGIREGRILLDNSRNDKKQIVKLILEFPVSIIDGSMVQFLYFICPSVGDLRCMDKYKKDELIAKTIHLTSKITNQSINVIEQMHIKDFQYASAIVQLFF